MATKKKAPKKAPAKKPPAKKAPPRKMKQQPLPHTDPTQRGVAELRRAFERGEVRREREDRRMSGEATVSDYDEEEDDLSEAARAVDDGDEELAIPGSRGTSVLMKRKGRILESGKRRGVRTVRRVVSYLEPSLWSELDAKARSVGFTLSECMGRAVSHWLKLPLDVQTAIVKNKGVESR